MKLCARSSFRSHCVVAAVGGGFLLRRRLLFVLIDLEKVSLAHTHTFIVIDVKAAAAAVALVLIVSVAASVYSMGEIKRLSFHSDRYIAYIYLFIFSIFNIEICYNRESRDAHTHTTSLRARERKRRTAAAIHFSYSLFSLVLVPYNSSGGSSSTNK